MKRVLVTGARGFIGRHCLPILAARGYEVHAVTSGNICDLSSEACWYQADLLAESQVRSLVEKVRPTHLLHLAWYTEPGRYWNAVENISWVRASIGLLEEFRRAGGHRVVMAGSCAEYDWRYGYCSEGVTPLLPRTVYGVCKNSLQQMLTVYGAECGLGSAWGRIFFVYGPYEHPMRLVPSVIRALLEGRPAQCTHGDQIRDFLHVHDAAAAFAAMLDSDVSGPVNIGSGNPVRIREVVAKIAEHLGRNELVQLGAIEPPSDDPGLLVADNGRLSGSVGWKPCQDLDSGLKQTINWWAENIKREG